SGIRSAGQQSQLSDIRTILAHARCGRRSAEFEFRRTASDSVRFETSLLIGFSAAENTEGTENLLRLYSPCLLCSLRLKYISRESSVVRFDLRLSTHL